MAQGSTPMLTAITRDVGPGISRCELTHLPRIPVDYRLACAQHAAYEGALRAAGCDVVSLPADAELPDSVFVEDTAVVLDEIAVLTRPGAPSRRPEVEAVAGALSRHRPLARIEPPGTLDGGDVLVAGRTIHVGRSARTNRAGIEQLRAHVAPLGYEVRPAPVTGCLHLKSAVTLVAPDTLLLNPAWTDPGGFDSHRLIEVDPAEPFAANALRVGSGVICSSAFPRTLERLEARGVTVIPVDVSELQKAEGGVTCCSLVFRTSPPRGGGPVVQEGRSRAAGGPGAPRRNPC